MMVDLLSTSVAIDSKCKFHRKLNYFIVDVDVDV